MHTSALEKILNKQTRSCLQIKTELYIKAGRVYILHKRRHLPKYKEVLPRLLGRASL